jgi:NADH-quinone oxidoreductase subunit G
MPKCTIDGKEIEVANGTTVIQAAEQLGIRIPRFCWHPDLAVDGNCRMCQVEIEGVPKLQIACNTPIKDGMEIRTRTEQVKEAREGVMELLLVNHPLDCPICDQAGECKLQDYAFEYGVEHARTREPRRAAKKGVDFGPTITFDQERCILCRRCVRFCREVPGTGEIGIFGRGDHSTIETFPGMKLDNPYSMNVADICPVGALTTKDFRFKIRVWFLEDVPGVCTGCAKGCNVWLGTANNKVYRYVPRRNDAVNETWICDSGRLSYKHIGSADRLGRAMVRGELGVLETTSLDRALAAAAARLRALVDAKGPGVIGAVASGHGTNEDLEAFVRLLDGLGVEARGLATLQGDSDELLVQAEKAANGEGARALGFGDASAVIDRLKGGGLEALVVMGHDLLDAQHLGEGALDVFARLDTLIVLDTHHSALERVAHVVIPSRHAAEKAGHFTNHAGIVQALSPAVEPAGDAVDEAFAFDRIATALAAGEDAA